MTNAFLSDIRPPDKDYNQEILKMIQERMEIGKERYGHGLRVEDDTRQWGTKEDSWTEMGLEEALDLVIYLSAQILRIQKREAQGRSVVHSQVIKPLGFIDKIRRWLRW